MRSAIWAALIKWVIHSRSATDNKAVSVFSANFLYIPNRCAAIFLVGATCVGVGVFFLALPDDCA